MSQRFRTLVRTGITVVASLTLLVAIWGTQPSQFQDRAGVREREGEGEELSLQALARRGPRQLPIMVVREKIGESGEAERFGGPAAEAYENRALPRANIKFKQVKRAIVASEVDPVGAHRSERPARRRMAGARPRDADGSRDRDVHGSCDPELRPRDVDGHRADVRTGRLRDLGGRRGRRRLVRARRARSRARLAAARRRDHLQRDRLPRDRPQRPEPRLRRYRRAERLG